MLELKDLSCQRAEQALFSGLHLHLHQGDCVEVRGTNGSGKSTLLRIVAGLAQDFTGEVFWRGQKVEHDRLTFQKDCLFLGHQPAIKPSLTVTENLQWLTALKVPCEEQRLQQAIAQVGLAHRAATACHHLSAGQQRRVALASLLTTACDLWVLDEPFTALDDQGVTLVTGLLQRHLQLGGIVIVATHQRLQGIPHSRELQL